MTYVAQNKANLINAASAIASGELVLVDPPEPPRPPRLRQRLAARMTRRTLALAAIFAVAVPVGVGASVVVLRHETAPPARILTAPLGAGPDGRLMDRPPLRHVPTSMTEAWSRLSQPPNAADRDNALIVGWAEHARRFGANGHTARVMATIDGKRIWLIPGNGFVCIAVETLGARELTATCDEEAVALHDGVYVTESDTVYGLLPDGIHQIDVTDDDGFHHTEPVTDNAYLLRKTNATVRYRTAAGEELFRIIT
jgi:hypothetical protein